MIQYIVNLIKMVHIEAAAEQYTGMTEVVLVRALVGHIEAIVAQVLAIAKPI